MGVTLCSLAVDATACLNPGSCKQTACNFEGGLSVCFFLSLGRAWI